MNVYVNSEADLGIRDDLGFGSLHRHLRNSGWNTHPANQPPTQPTRPTESQVPAVALTKFTSRGRAAKGLLTILSANVQAGEDLGLAPWCTFVGPKTKDGIETPLPWCMSAGLALRSWSSPKSGALRKNREIRFGREISSEEIR